ncbi:MULTISPECIES: hypothetical protein [unclassified Streptomyces]
MRRRVERRLGGERVAERAGAQFDAFLRGAAAGGDPAGVTPRQLGQ